MKLRFCSASILLVLVGAFGPASAKVPADSIVIKGLENEVTVRRDQRSIPYIEAQSLEDLYFAQGFETARDRLW
ncbi:MAG: penicillin acylase family protein, partial [Acidobacteriota bacterium]|nr:penicillin acylase family protein [Acidobacteriota bacterium]